MSGCYLDNASKGTLSIFDYIMKTLSLQRYNLALFFRDKYCDNVQSLSNNSTFRGESSKMLKKKDGNIILMWYS